jgi:hypothetical protein
MHWSVSPGMGGQLAPEWSGQVQQNLQTEAKAFETGFSLEIIIITKNSEEMYLNKFQVRG